MRLLVLVCFLFHRRAGRLGSQTTNRFFNYSRDIPFQWRDPTPRNHPETLCSTVTKDYTAGV
jgi:hypothetical protein